MLPKGLRLPPVYFKAGYSESVRSRFFALKARENDLGHNRFGVVISNKVDKRSTSRHRLKRVIADSLGRWPNFSRDFLLVVLPAAGGESAADIRADLGRILTNLKKQTA